MEANIVVKAEDLTPDFAEGIRKVFSRTAVLHIRVEYDLSINQPSSDTIWRGPKPKVANQKPSTPGKKRGPKPKQQTPVEGPKKRGPKPKSAAQ